MSGVLDTKGSRDSARRDNLKASYTLKEFCLLREKVVCSLCQVAAHSRLMNRRVQRNTIPLILRYWILHNFSPITFWLLDFVWLSRSIPIHLVR